MILKCTAKVGHITETAPAADLTDGELGVRQHTFCSHDPGLQNVVHNRKARDFFEFSAEVVLTDVDFTADRIHADILGYMLVDVFHRLLDDVRGLSGNLNLVFVQTDKQ